MVCVVAALCAVAVRARADVVSDLKFPIHGEAVRLIVTDASGNGVAGADVTATYRPASAVPHTEPVGTTGTDGYIEWTPTDAGLATVTATWTDAGGVEQTSQTALSIRYSSPPVAGILIMIIAGIVLIGGGLHRIHLVLRAPEPD